MTVFPRLCPQACCCAAYPTVVDPSDYKLIASFRLFPLFRLVSRNPSVKSNGGHAGQHAEAASS